MHKPHRCLVTALLALAATGCTSLPASPAPTASASTRPLAESPAAPQASGRATAVTVSAPLPSPSVTPSSPASATPTPAPTPDVAGITLQLVPVVAGLTSPVDLKAPADGRGRLFVVEKPGRVQIVRDGQLAPRPFLDIADRVRASGSEQGLLGIAFHPGYGTGAAAAGRFYVAYTDPKSSVVVAEYRTSADPDLADATSERILLTDQKPATNHNGGNLVFGPDGYLYIGTGDGGGEGDPFANGQKPSTLLGKMLRIDVDNGDPYGIPPDNPFANSSTFRHEIWSFGLRNPWRYSFDRQTGDLFIGDVGQDAWEEVDFQPAGANGGQNYGWSLMEGNHCYPGGGTACSAAGSTVLPVLEYSHDLGCAIIGGYVYRGRQSPVLSGLYLFGDECSGRIWAGYRDSSGAWRMSQLAQSGLALSSFGEDQSGEVYAVDLGGGIYRLVATGR